MKKLTLADYYDTLPTATTMSPKSDFVKQVAKECNVSINTVRNWILNDMKPSNPAHIEVLSRITKINETELWDR